MIISKVASSENIDYQCSHSDEFFYTTPQSHCTSYYRCHINQKIKYDCPYGTVFDFYKQKCVNSASKSSQTLAFTLDFIDLMRNFQIIQMFVTSQRVKERLTAFIQTQRKLVADIFDVQQGKSLNTRIVEMASCTTARFVIMLIK